MENNITYKNRALASLEGKWANGIIATLILGLILEGVSTIITLPMGDDFTLTFGSSSIWSLICLPLAWGGAIFFLRLIRNEDISYSRLFDGYSDFVRIFGTKFLVGLYEALWGMLLIVPGIIKGYSYSMTDFILKDNPELKYNAAIEKSMAMMEGHKKQLFLIDLSLIGWFLLSCLTLGLGFLMLIPYAMSIHAHFYEDLLIEQN